MRKPLKLTRPSFKISSFLLKLLFLAIMALTVTGLAKMYSYFKVGAERTDLLTAAQQQKSIHDPSYTWDLSESKEGVVLDEYTRQEIQDAYTYAWYILNTSISSQKDLGLADRFSKNMIAKIEKGFATDNLYKVERADLNHNIKLHLFSFDRQLVSFSDDKVRLVKRTINKETGSAYQAQDTISFDVVMGLEDGYWKVFDLIQLESKSEQETDNLPLKKREISSTVRAINYYPSSAPWFEFWRNYNAETVGEDLKLLKKLSFNHTRIFIPYELFGKGTLNEKMIGKLDDFLNQCQNQNITVTLSLFDFPESYQLAFYPATRQHLLQLIDRYHNHPALSIWDLKNEPDLDFANYGQEVVVNWLDFMIDEAKAKAPHINLTIGWSKVDFLEICAEKLDLQSFHLYGDIALHRTHLRKLTKEGKITKPLYLSEFGKTTFRSKFLPFGSTEKQQAIFTRDALDFIEEEKIDYFAYWTLFDFIEAPKEIIGWKPWIRSAQENMGLITIEGREKITVKNFTNEDYEVESLTLLDKTYPFYFFIAFFLIIFSLTFYKFIIRN